MPKFRNTNIFIKEAQQVHQNPDGTPKYDYSQSYYTGKEFKLKIICPKHGVFEQRAGSHLRGQGCPKCGIELRSSKRRFTKDDFISKAQQVHQNPDGTPKYDYSQVDYVNSQIKIKIICPKHGVFEQLPNAHLMGQGCPKCSIEAKSLTADEFILRAQQIHKKHDGTPKYDYSQINYVNTKTKVKIICPKHGVFEQLPEAHLFRKEGCPKCFVSKVSNLEYELHQFLKNIIEIKENNCYILDNHKEIDIYIPSLQIAIEYDGLYYHSQKYGKDKNYHILKTIECEDKNIRLIHIFEDEYYNTPNIVKDILLNIIGKTFFKIPARKCYIKIVNKKQEQEFLKKYSLHAENNSTICFGLFYLGKNDSLTKKINGKENKEYLVSLISFNQLNEFCWELNNFCSINNFIIQGGISKLFKYFLKQFNPKQIITYADRRWFNNKENNVYKILGFKFQKYIEPISYQCKNYKRFESNIIDNNTIWDCGKIEYIWKL